MITRNGAFSLSGLKSRVHILMGKDAGVFFLATSQFGLTFGFSFMMAFLPFYIAEMSSYGEQETILWTGMILGVPNYSHGHNGSFLGGLTSRFRPKLLYERGFLCHAILILMMGFTKDIRVLFLIRIIQGAIGGVSTIGLILISVLSPSETLPKHMALFQNVMIAGGQLAGPLLGTYAAFLCGYQGAFIASLYHPHFFCSFATGR